ncbi:MAG: cytochrome P450 [Deltaproteobacteria bacterium]|nr:cytochrome P450 [Deltaproteobacteria bacterium]
MSTNPTLSRAVELADINLMDNELYRDGFPHEVFRTLRREAPVWWQAIPDEDNPTNGPGFWVLSKYEDVQAANRNSELFCAIDGPSIHHTPEMRDMMLVSMDGAHHTRQRKIISAGFTPRMVGRLEEQARTWAVKIVENALELGTCEFVQDVAYQLPMHMIADIVGIPLKDRESLFQITKDFLSPGDPDDPASEATHMAAQVKMFQYAQELGQRKRENPQDDVWTIISNAEVETEDGQSGKMSEIELDFFFLLLTLAGSETTRNAIAHGLIALLEHPDQLETLRNDPEAMRPAVEEILRWSSPVAYFARRATRDTEIRGVKIKEGDRVTLWYPSANRDEEVFEDPFRFDIARTPNQHVAFGGGGAHFCLGANLARREIAIIFEELLARTQKLEIIKPTQFSVLGIYNPILVIPQQIEVRMS